MSACHAARTGEDFQFRREVSPGLVVALDDSGCNVIIESSRTQHTVTNVDALCSALKAAQGAAQVNAAVALDAAEAHRARVRAAADAARGRERVRRDGVGAATYVRVPPVPGGHQHVWQCQGDLCGALVRYTEGKRAHDRAFHPERILTYTQARMLRDVRDSGDSGDSGASLRTMSEYGGGTATQVSLYRLGLLRNSRLTDEGLAAINRYDGIIP